MPQQLSIRLGHDVVTGILRGFSRSQIKEAIKEWERNAGNNSKYYHCVSIGEWNTITIKNRCPMEHIND